MRSRRAFLRWLGLVVLGPLAAHACPGQRGGGPRTNSVDALLPAEACVELGRYLLASNREMAVRLAREAERELRRAARADRDELEAWYARRVRLDFSQSRTVSVDGWWLSNTEAGLSVLKALEVEEASDRDRSQARDASSAGGAATPVSQIR